jgi:2-polyprenyl-3-methyl-5-hydroxy-6-metoxy-1,4-benzoquinol methylase
MLPSADVIRGDFDRIAMCSREQPDRIEPSVQRLVAQIPLRSRVLEVGCGTGALARVLATRRGAKVTAIDLSPRMIDIARVRTPALLGVEYHVADFLSLEPRGFDVVIATNTLHHLPLEEAVSRMAAAVSGDGLLLLADLFEARGLSELPYNGLSWILRAPNRVPGDLDAAWAAHGLRDRLQPWRSVRRSLRSLLPGVSVRRHLGWRYSAIWQRA